jgi:hypothetical protein
MINEKTRRPRRLSKESLNRTKWAAGGLSVLAFAGSLFGIIALNPGVKLAAASQGVAQPVAPQAPSSVIAPDNGLSAGGLPAAPQLNSGALTAPIQPQVQRLRPFTRTRGS